MSKNDNIFITPVSTYIKSRKEWDKRYEAISNKNEALMKQWDKEDAQRPWWKFWEKGISFEEKRSIIINSYGGLN